MSNKKKQAEIYGKIGNSAEIIYVCTDFREEHTHSRTRNPAWTVFPVSYWVPFTAAKP